MHEVPTSVLPSHYLQSGHQLGYKLLSKFKGKNKSAAGPVAARKHQLVSTSVSSLEPDTAEVCVPVNTDIASALVVVEESMSTDMESSAAITAAMELVSRDLRRKQQGVQDDIEEFTEDDIDLTRIPTVERDLDRILARFV